MHCRRLNINTLYNNVDSILVMSFNQFRVIKLYTRIEGNFPEQQLLIRSLCHGYDLLRLTIYLKFNALLYPGRNRYLTM
ncbi:hypothetical protein AQUCO_01700597v1 [Aquilegia coerulea]|uniref:Uncharacterized protein n=1 Tax=Aquilegia coerulea TaxID=218851 RepID=A0A2G5DNZ2_AQUCA|nr:hypothetical protein AQUCO_01700597v1 [Aquilegia coerulea]